MDPITIIGAATLGFIIGQGGHQQDGFRDTGCDPTAQVAILSERTGEVLYYNNPTCPVPSGPSDSVAGPATPTTPDNGGDNGNGGEGSPTNGNGGTNSNGNGNGGPKGNASANNGKGGNYDQTGHVDNNKGNGKGRR